MKVCFIECILVLLILNANFGELTSDAAISAGKSGKRQSTLFAGLPETKPWRVRQKNSDRAWDLISPLDLVEHWL